MSRQRNVLGAAIVLLAGTLGVGAAAQAPVKCFGEAATQVGTNGDDTIRGTNGHDVIVTRGGADTVHGEGGFDLICGGPGPDGLFGGPGGEFIFGGEGNDKLYGGRGPFSDYAPGPGDDLVEGRDGADDIVHFQGAQRPVSASLITQRATGQGSDKLVSADVLLGGPFGDTLIGNAFDNALVGRAGKDTLRGGEGFDFIAGQAGDDEIHGGADFDIADYWEENSHSGRSVGPVTVDLIAGTAAGDGSDTLGGIEGATGTAEADTMVGDDNGNAFFLLVGGDDTVNLGDGDDFVDAGKGADDLSGGGGLDFLGMFDGLGDRPRTTGVTVDLAGNTTSDGDTLSGFESASGTSANDTFTGDGGSNGLFPFDGDDTVTAGGGDDLVDPGNGVDSADGQAGVDLLGNIDHYEGAVTIDLSDNSNSDGDTLASFEDMLGSPFPDSLTGDGGPNLIFGYRGDDVLSGLAGADLLAGEGGHDSADGGDGSDRCQAEHQQNCEFGWSRSLVGRSVGKSNWAYPWRSTLHRLGFNHLDGVAR